MAYHVQATRPAQDPTQHFQVRHATALLHLGGRPMPRNISGLTQPFPYSGDWRGRAGIGPFPGPRAAHARDFDNPMYSYE